MLLEDLPAYDILYSKIFVYLDWLSLKNLQLTSPAMRERVSVYCEYAEVLNFQSRRSGEQIDYDTFVEFTKRARSLRVLKFPKGKEWLDNQLVIPILKNNTKLIELGMEDTKLKDEASVLVLCVNNKCLQVLYLDDCTWLSPIGLEILFNRLTTTIRKLSIARVAVDDKIVTSFFRRFVNLENINITGCWRLTNRSLIFLKEYCPRLKVVVCLQCPNLNDPAIFNDFRAIGVSILCDNKATTTPPVPPAQQMPNLQI